MYAGLNVDHAALDQASQDVLRAVSAIRAELQGLDQLLQPLREGWTGAAKASYDLAKARWDTAIEEMVILLADSGNSVTAANAEYRATDLRNARRF